MNTKQLIKKIIKYIYKFYNRSTYQKKLDITLSIFHLFSKFPSNINAKERNQTHQKITFISHYKYTDRSDLAEKKEIRIYLRRRIYTD